MLSKLIKHDLISLSKRITIAWLIFGVLFLLDIIVGKTITDDLEIGKIMFVTMASITVFIGFSWSGLLASFGWFSKKMFSNQGYLTHTLPAKTSTIVLSKIISTFILSGIGFILALLSSYILSIALLGDMFQQMNAELPLAFSGISEVLTEVFSDLGLKIAISQFLKVLSFILLVFFCISLAQLTSSSARGLLATLYFILISIALAFIAAYVMEPFAYTSTVESSLYEINRDLNRSFLLGYISNSVQIVLFWLGTMAICSRKLNLKG